ncbi:helix-turn-helix transcriptional regulator [Streptomyces sp. NBC_01381]|uniref:MmyB family transcriptional regulator n=1 Tax=Streptomyces sp. NBC_01381 TaxID=2903845 RepID=UPI00225828BE|nr:helix-turn-helix domain-containing protein [Streptomyces sp. NBC_01381]MCX4666568.1 helix-turn-helix transcriptional regulator [Streptomyces sp. NBC_01381]
MPKDLPQITRMLKAWRDARDPKAVPGFTAQYGVRRRKGLTQAEVAMLAGVTEGWYGKVERGTAGHVGEEFLDRIVRILDLNDAQRAHLYFEANGCAPEPHIRPDASTIDPVLSAIIHVLPWPAYSFDSRWDIRVFNECAGRDFPWMLHGVNVMIWALTYPEARLQLVDWEETWAKPMASQLRLAHKANPDDARLTEVCNIIKERDEGVRRLLEHDVTTVTHPDGDRRSLYLPHQHEEEEVEFVTLPRMRDSTRLMIVMPGDIAQQAKDAIPSTIASVLAGTEVAPASS